MSLSVLAAPPAAPDGPAILHVVGEVDASNAGVLTLAIVEAFDSTSGPLTVDCTRWTFVDAAGLRVLRHLGDEARRRKRTVFLANMSEGMHRLLHHTGVDRHFDLGMAGYRSP